MKRIVNNLIYFVLIFLLFVNIKTYASTYQNNAIEFSVNTSKSVYELAENIDLNIQITNKNRYGKLHYKITSVDSNDNFRCIGNINQYKTIAPLKNDEIIISNQDIHASYNKKRNIGKHAKEIEEKLATDSIIERLGKNNNEEIHQNELYKKHNHIYGDYIRKVRENPLNLLFVLLIIIIFAFLIFLIYKFIKKKHRSFIIIIFISFSMICAVFSKKVYAKDIYIENEHYEGLITTRCTYANIPISFQIGFEYYFENVIIPINDFTIDTDNDLLPDYLEVLYLTDLENNDTDGDGLFDGIEVYNTFTDPLRVDTDENGIRDGDEDYDNDGLTNIEEVSYGTDPSKNDTDYDLLSDYDEINGIKVGINTYYSDPTNDDTDFDTLIDGIEIKLSLNPDNDRTDGVTLDSERKIYQTIDTIPESLSKYASTPIKFYGEVKGNINEKVTCIESKDRYFDTLRACIGTPIHIDTEYGGSDGLKVSFDVSKYESIKKRLMLCKVNGTDLTPVNGSYLSGNEILGDVTSGDYCLVDTRIILEEANVFMK